mgnify:CR=1 FL=1
MKYVITFRLTTEHYEERISRFLETGAQPPAGVTMLGRWFTLGHDRGFMVAQTDDPTNIFRWVAEWSHLIDFEVHAVLEDHQVAEVLAAQRS